MTKSLTLEQMRDDADTDYCSWTIKECKQVQAELRRLDTVNKELIGTLVNIAYGLEGARIWGGMEWHYNPLHAFKYLPLRDKAREMIEKYGER